MAKVKSSQKISIKQQQQEAALRSFGLRLQREREQQNLSMRQLALDTRVSTAVLEALEKGWIQRLPEAAFLGTILKKLAERLALPKTEVAEIIKTALPPIHRNSVGGDGALTGFTLGSIELFSTWQGTIAYGTLLMALIYGLNLQQQQLIRSGSFSPAPIAPQQGLKKEAQPLTKLLQLYPELRPLP